MIGMPRILRIQYAGARYHVINRGNYRANVFSSEGAVGALWDAGVPVTWIAEKLRMENQRQCAVSFPDNAMPKHHDEK
jgi:hypothetical protein